MKSYHRVFLFWQNPETSSVFLQNWNGFFSLPCIKLHWDARPKIQIEGWLCERVRLMAGQKALAGDYLHYQKLEDGSIEAILEILPQEDAQLEGDWHLLDELDSLRFSDPFHIKVLQKSLSSEVFQLPQRLARIQEKLGVSDFLPIQMKTGSSSFLFQLEFRGKKSWLKLMREKSSAEVISISQEFPELQKWLPANIEYDSHERWELMEDAGRILNIFRAPPEVQARMFRAWARCQIASIGISSERRQKLNQWDENYFRSSLTELSQDEVFLGQLSDDEKKEWERKIPQILAELPRWNENLLPHTLLHGDLHFGNVGHKEDEFRFLDLNSAGWGFPLLDLVRFEVDAGPVWPGLRRAYFQEWKEFQSEEALHRIWVSLFDLAAMAQALHFYSGRAGIYSQRAMMYTLWFTRVMLHPRIQVG